MPQLPGAGDSPDQAVMSMLLTGPCDRTAGSSTLGTMGEFSGRVGSPLNPFTVAPRLLMGEVELPILDPSCRRDDLYELGMAFTPEM